MSGSDYVNASVIPVSVYSGRVLVCLKLTLLLFCLGLQSEKCLYCYPRTNSIKLWRFLADGLGE